MTADRSGRVIVPAERLHGAGPWLVVHASGEGPAHRAVRAQEECERRGVVTRVSELGKTRNFDHGKYRSLILIGEDIGEVRSATLIALRDMARDYRARWSHDLKDARAGRGDFVDWGVVQVILCEGPEIYSSSEAQTLEALACASHRVANFDAAVLFDAYTGVIARPAGAMDDFCERELDDREANRLWKRLEVWGVCHRWEVGAVLRIIEECRNKYEAPRYTALRRPVEGRNLNRLDFVLDERFYEPQPGPGLETWRRDGQRVVRETAAAITEELAHVSNPRRTKGAVESFQDFHRNLQLLRNYLRLTE